MLISHKIEFQDSNQVSWALTESRNTVGARNYYNPVNLDMYTLDACRGN